MERLAAWIWGTPMLTAMLGVGLLLSVRTRFVQIRKLGASFRMVGRSISGRNRSSFQAVCTALAGTVGTGNIAGVAGAIALGGPGAVFWMWISAFLGMATKYAEVVLAIRYRRSHDNGDVQAGPMYYIRLGMGERWRLLAAWFSLSTVLVSFGMGNMVQIHTMVSAMQTALPRFRPEPTALITGLAAALLVLSVTMGGIRVLGSLMEKLVPLLAAVYVLGAVWVLAVRWQKLGPVLQSILVDAFCPAAVAGGTAGIGMRQAIRWGVSRGLFSNEAGLGSAPIAHGAADATAEEQGLMGIFEVFLDTIVLCTLTALVVLTTDCPIGYGSSAGAELVTSALETVFGRGAAVGMAVILGLLAMGTLLTWQLYGVRCAQYLWGDWGVSAYRICFVAVVLLGATMDLTAVWAISDLFNAAMCIPNLVALLVLRGQISEKEYNLQLDFHGTAFHNESRAEPILSRSENHGT